MAHGKTRIGTSGWLYKHWLHRFYPEKLNSKQMFQYYKDYFDTVELNNPFYRLPSPETFAGWKERSPEGFLYAVKASRYITHIKKLKEVKDSVDLFLFNASMLGEKMGPVLFQLPPSWKFDEERLAEFLELLPGDHRFTIEFRNHTWYNDITFDLLKKYNVSFCIYELEYHLSPLETTADFVYIRLHGPGKKYQGSYPDKTLRTWASRCRQWNSEKKDVYIYFDNDQNAYAAFNALDLKKELGK
jgi:uncharacterized protein YecE (DUF72 family)